MHARKIITGFAIAAALVAGTVAPSGAASRWESQVTGAAVFDVGSYTGITVDVSSRIAADGSVKGQVQYTRSDLSVHVAVDCVYVGDNGDVAISGPVKVQEGTANFTHMTVEIRDGGTILRVPTTTSAPTAANDCGYTGTSGVAIAADSFNMRT